MTYETNILSSATSTASTASLFAGLFVSVLLFHTIRSQMESPVMRKALRMMAFTYSFFGLVCLLEVWSQISFPDADNVWLFRATTLIVAVVQAFMFTYTLILLIRDANVTRRRIIRELILVSGFSSLFLSAYFVLPSAWVNTSFYLFTLFYACLLIRYTRLFIILYRNCLRKMDNFFSGQEAKRLQWINVSFYAALSIGLLALVTSLTPGGLTEIICSGIYFLFYVLFAIRLINFGFVYRDLEEALSEDDDLDFKKLEETGQEENNKALPLSVRNTIEANLKSWMTDKQFLQADITISEVSSCIGTNKKYLSIYINQYMNTTFRNWINDLRIEEAKKLLQENPEMPVKKISDITGFNHNYFGKLFLKNTGMTPITWRKEKRGSESGELRI